MSCPSPELLFEELFEGAGPALEHAATCADCSGLLEEHRQLEKDLSRIVDPLPPPDFLNQVMARVAAAPHPHRTELRSGAAVLGVSLSLFFASVLGGKLSPGAMAVSVAATMGQLQGFLGALHRGLSVVWQTAALPLMVALVTVFLFSLFGLRRLAVSPVVSQAKVSR